MILLVYISITDIYLLCKHFFRDFDVQLYLCNGAFTFLQADVFMRLTKLLAFPLYAVFHLALLVALAYALLQKWRWVLMFLSYTVFLCNGERGLFIREIKFHNLLLPIQSMCIIFKNMSKYESHLKFKWHEVLVLVCRIYEMIVHFTTEPHLSSIRLNLKRSDPHAIIILKYRIC